VAAPALTSSKRQAGRRNYRRTTDADASLGTNVISSLVTAVAFLCFPTYFNMFVADNA